jgi:hypothetical protein
MAECCYTAAAYNTKTHCARDVENTPPRGETRQTMRTLQYLTLSMPYAHPRQSSIHIGQVQPDRHGYIIGMMTLTSSERERDAT